MTNTSIKEVRSRYVFLLMWCN